MTKTTYSRDHILLAAQSALLGEVFPGLLAVDMSWTFKLVEFTFFVVAELNEIDRESVSSVEAEMSAHLPGVDLLSHVIVGDPGGHNRGQACVFAARG